jgi:hypothetical protein
LIIEAVYSSTCNTNNIKAMSLNISKISIMQIKPMRKIARLRIGSDSNKNNDSCEIEEENILESERRNQKPLNSSINKPREEMNAQFMKQFPPKSSTPNSKNIHGFSGEFFQKENDSASLGDINEIYDFNVNKNTQHIGLKLRGDSVDLSR